MPVNLDEVRRAFSGEHIADAVNGNVTGGDASGRGDASDGDGASSASVARPNVHVSGGDRTVDPASVRPAADTGKRARTGTDNVARIDAAKSRARVSSSDPEAASNIEALLFSVHLLLSEQTQINALMLPPKKAEAVAKAIATVNSFYGNKKNGVISPKQWAWINLVIALGGAYVPMFLNVRAENKMKTIIDAGKNGNSGISTGT